MATVTKVAVRAVLTITGTTLVVECCREVDMSDVERFVATTADATGCALVEGAHGVQHRGAVLRAHPEADFRGVERYWSTGRQISHYCLCS